MYFTCTIYDIVLPNKYLSIYLTGANHELNLTSARETAQKVGAEYQKALGFGYDDPIPSLNNGNARCFECMD